MSFLETLEGDEGFELRPKPAVMDSSKVLASNASVVVLKGSRLSRSSRASKSNIKKQPSLSNDVPGSKLLREIQAAQVKSKVKFSDENESEPLAPKISQRSKASLGLLKGHSSSYSSLRLKVVTKEEPEKKIKFEDLDVETGEVKTSSPAGLLKLEVDSAEVSEDEEDARNTDDEDDETADLEEEDMDDESFDAQDIMDYADELLREEEERDRLFYEVDDTTINIIEDADSRGEDFTDVEDFATTYEPDPISSSLKKQNSSGRGQKLSPKSDGSKRTIKSFKSRRVKKVLPKVPCLSFHCRVFMFPEDRKRARHITYRTKGFVRKPKVNTVSFSDMATFYVYSTAIDEKGKHPDFGAFAKHRVETGLLYKDHRTNPAKRERKRKKLEKKNTESRKYRNLFRELDNIIGDKESKIIFAERVIMQLLSVLDTLPTDEAALIAEYINTEEFKNMLVTYITLLLMNLAAEDGRCFKMFAHSFVSMDNENHEQNFSNVIGFLNKFFNRYCDYRDLDLQKFKLDWILPDELMQSLKGKLLLRKDRSTQRIESKRDTATKTMCRRQSITEKTSAGRQIVYVDLLSDDPVPDLTSQFRIDFPNAVINDDRDDSSIDKQLVEGLMETPFQDFLKEPKKTLFLEKSRWSLQYMVLMNRGIATSLFNRNESLLHYLLKRRAPEAVAEGLKSFDEYYRSHSIKRKGKGQIEVDPTLDEATRSVFGMAISSEGNLQIHRRDPKKRSILQFLRRSKRFIPVQNYAYSPFLNPIVRADLHYSRRRGFCSYTCSSHRGKLLLTLIHMNNAKMVKFVLNYGIPANLKSCAGQCKRLFWTNNALVDEVIPPIEKKTKGLGNAIRRAFGRSTKVFKAESRSLKNKLKQNKSTIIPKSIDGTNFLDDDCNILRQKFEKISPLSVAIDCFLQSYRVNAKRSKDNLHADDEEELNTTYKLLLEKGADFTYNKGDAMDSFVAIIEGMERGVRSSNEKHSDKTTYTETDNQSARSVLEFKDFETAVSQTFEAATSGLSTAGSLVETGKAFSTNGPEFIILLRAKLLFHCLVHQKYQAFRFMLPRYMIKLKSPKEKKMLMIILDSVLRMITGKAASAQPGYDISILLQALVFISKEYGQLTAEAINAMCFAVEKQVNNSYETSNNRTLRGSLDIFLRLSEVRMVLLSSFLSVEPNKGILSKRIRMAVCCLKLGLFGWFEKILSKQALMKLYHDNWIELSTDVVVKRQQVFVLGALINFIQEKTEITSKKFTDEMFDIALGRNGPPKCFLAKGLIMLGCNPTFELSSLFLLNSILSKPLLTSEHATEDRMADITSIILIDRLLAGAFAQMRTGNLQTQVETYKKIVRFFETLYHALTECDNIENIWAEGLLYIVDRAQVSRTKLHRATSREDIQEIENLNERFREVKRELTDIAKREAMLYIDYPHRKRFFLVVETTPVLPQVIEYDD